MGWTRFFRRRYWNDERSREMEAYLEAETADNIARGMTPAEARSAAHRKFGNPTLIREEIYHMNSIGFVETLWQDLRYGARQLWMSPGFAFVAILSLALGIGANTAIFQLLDAVRLRSLPVRNPQELAEVRIVGGNGGMGVNTSAYSQLTRPIWNEIKDQKPESFSGLFAWSAGGIRVGPLGESKNVTGVWVSGNFFPVLGIEPWRGRLFVPEDEAAACPVPLAVVSYAYWQRAMGGRELGSDSKLILNGDLHEVIGVTPPGFSGLAVGESFDIALPFCQSKELRRDVFILAVMGRLRPGWTLERASAEMETRSPGIFETTALSGYSASTIERYRNFRLAAYPASAGVSQLRAIYDSSLWLLLSITGLVLLIACANLANLMLARASARGREIAVRRALGASRGRLLRQLLSESALLAAVGAVLGIGLAQLLSRALVASLSTNSTAWYLPIEADWRVLLFTAAVAALTCLIFGALPALRSTRVEPVAAMKAGGRGMTAGRDRFSLQRLMVVTQVAVSLVLLVGALLFVRSFRNLMTFNPGLRQEGITLAYLGFPQSNLPPERLADLKRELVDDVRAVPGVLDAATTTMVPLLGGGWSHGVRIESAEGSSMFTWVSPSYFQTMDIPLLMGRGFNENDTAASQRVAVVNQTFVHRYLGGANPIGKTLTTSPEPRYPSTVYEIVGVIPDTQYNSLRGETPPMTFAPASQFPAEGPWTPMMIHANGPAAVAAVRSTLSEKHAGIVMEFSDFQQRIRDGLVRDRLMATLSGFFGILAAVLAMVGLYGVISYTVARRRNEIGIRVALGADRRGIVAMILRDAAWLLAIGLAIGIALALAGAQTASALLFGLSANDPATYILGVAALATVALLASYVPARRAARLEPTVALREE